MAPTVIVGDDENAGDVAARLLDLADHQRDVKVRTDTRGPAFDVPDDVYLRYIGKGDRADDEQRVNAIARQQDEQAGRDDLDGPLVSDELPALAVNADPMDNTDGFGEIEGDDLPEAARVVEPPSNGDAPNDGSGFTPDDDGDGDQGDEPEVEDKPKPKPRKRTPRKAASSPATPPAPDAGTGE
jgi:hypothetical protein